MPSHATLACIFSVLLALPCAEPWSRALVRLMCTYTYVTHRSAADPSSRPAGSSRGSEGSALPLEADDVGRPTVASVGGGAWATVTLGTRTSMSWRSTSLCHQVSRLKGVEGGEGGVSDPRSLNVRDHPPLSWL